MAIKYLSVCSFVCLSVCLCFCLFFCLSVCMSIFLVCMLLFWLKHGKVVAQKHSNQSVCLPLFVYLSLRTVYKNVLNLE